MLLPTLETSQEPTQFPTAEHLSQTLRIYPSDSSLEICLDVSKESEERRFCFWTIKTITFPGYSKDL